MSVPQPAARQEQSVSSSGHFKFSRAPRDPPQVRHSINGLNREHSWKNETKITENSSEVRDAASFGTRGS